VAVGVAVQPGCTQAGDGPGTGAALEAGRSKGYHRSNRLSGSAGFLNFYAIRRAQISCGNPELQPSPSGFIAVLKKRPFFTLFYDFLPSK
jgi:hypothetical protein